MAKLSAADPWASGDQLATRLQEELPDEYFIVADPPAAHRVLDALVIGPQGLFVLHCIGWEGEIQPARRGPWLERPAEGRELRHPNPSHKAQKASQVLKAFLRDEFPSLRPAIHHLLILTSPDVRLAGSGQTRPPCVSMERRVPDRRDHRA